MPMRSFLMLCAVLTLTTGTHAQQPTPPQPADAPAPAPRPRVPPPPDFLGQTVNIRVELSITDQIAADESVRKTVAVIVADRARASVRNDTHRRDGHINVDAQPQILSSGAIRLTVGLEYMPIVSSNSEDARRSLSRMNQQLTVILESGKPLVISQAPDPQSDRKVTVQVTATALK